MSSIAAPSILSSLRTDHPRLLLTREDEARVRQLRATSPYAEQLTTLTIRSARDILNAPDIRYEKEGRRLLHDTREGLRRILYCAMAYRLTGEAAFLARAEREMLAAAALPNWNPSHFLDAAEMGAGLALGYDWLFDHLSPATRTAVRAALIEKALVPGFADGEAWWIRSRNNWNQVCHGGLTLAALAIAEDEPEWAERTVRRAVECLPIVMDVSYNPDGVYPEGPVYWEYGTTYNVLLLAALDSALGTDFGLSRLSGFRETARFLPQVFGPDRDWFSFADCGRADSVPFAACLYWFARKFDDAELAGLIEQSDVPSLATLAAQPALRPDRFLPLALAWYREGREPETQLPLNYYGRGPNPVTSFRTSWQPDALWLAAKGGNNRNNHNHMDAGEFVLVAGGVRWSIALGGDNYYKLEQLPGNLWGEGRYDFFRLGVQGHSTLWLGGVQPELDDSASPVVAFHGSESRAHAVIDLSRQWRSQAAAVRRGVALLDRRSFLVQDEIVDARGEVLWQMITHDAIELAGASAAIRHNEKTFRLQVLAPAGAVFETLPVTPTHATENPNEGFAKLALRVPPAASANRTIAVHMWLDGKPEPAAPDLRPLAAWEGWFGPR